MKLLNCIKTLVAVGVLTAGASTAAFSAETTLKLGHLANEKNAWHLAAVKFGEDSTKCKPM